MRRLVLIVLVTGAAACSPGNTKSSSETDGGFTVDTSLEIDGAFDPTKDNDGDGWLFADDCDDRNPEVNPGAFDVPGDRVDNDCNGKIDDVVDCDTTDLVATSTDPFDLAKALGLCQTAKADATGKDKRWGVVDAQLVRADGTGSLDPVQFGITKRWGSWVYPRAGKNMVALSSGTARTPESDQWVSPKDPSYVTASSVTPPPGWPRNTVGCPAPFDKVANDSVNLKLTIRVPTNAKAFSFDFDFYSSEYLSYVCSEYNDTFVALIDSKVPLNPKYGKNICFDTLGNPINVNSGFFEVCTPGTSKSGTKFPCAKGITELQGTGYWSDKSPQDFGATSWLQTKAPVVPGETITLQFMIWDTGDHYLDSSVLVDNWQWDVAGTTAPETGRPK